MKRYINFRPLLLIFLTFIGAIYSVIKVFLGNFVPLIFFVIFVLFNIIVFVVCAFNPIFLERFFYLFGVKSAKICTLIVLCSAILASAVASINFVVKSNRAVENGNYNITASVKEVSNIDGNTKLFLGNVKINGKSYGFNMQANVESEFSVGDVLTFDGYLYATKLVKNGKIDTSILKTNLQYYCTINFENLTKTSGRASFTDIMKNKTKNVLLENMTEQNAGFAYTVLMGDKSLLSSNFYDTFKNAGLSHILAVSGMHIAFLVAILLFFLKLCKVKKKYQFFVVALVLLIYNILCNFSPSVFRASVMSLCLMLGLILGERNDSLSNISLAGIIVLMVQSLFLFDVGFLLSFGAVFGIFLFSKTFDRALQKIKLPKFLSASISVVLSATLGTLPWICKFFNQFSPITILSNLIVVPIFSVMYTILLISTLLNLIFSFPVLFTISQFFINIVSNWSAVFAKFGAISTIEFDTLSATIYYLVLFLVSPYFMINSKSKLLCGLSLIICLTASLSYCNSNKIIKENMVFATQNAKNSLFFTTKSGKTIICNVDSDKYEVNNLIEKLKANRINQVDYLILFNYNDELQNNVANIVNNLQVQNLYLVGEYQNSTVVGLTNAIYSTSIFHQTIEQSFEILDGEFNIERLSSAEKTLSVCYQMGDSKILQILSSVSQSQIQNEPIFAEKFLYVFVDKFNNKYNEIDTQKYICQNVFGTASNIVIIENGELWRSQI